VKADAKRDGQLDSIVRTIISAARLEFAEVAEVGDAGDRIDAIAAGINMLVEELKESAVSKEQLRQSEEKYRSLYESSLVGMFRTDIRNQRPVTANRRLAELFGYDSMTDFMQYFKSEHHYRNPEDRKLMLHLLSTHGELHNYELELVRKDGSTFWASCSGKLYAEEGHVEGSIVDITQQKVLVRQLKEAQRIARIGHWSLDLHSMQLDWSDEFFRILGLQPGSVPTYDNFLALVHPEDREFLDSSYWNSIRDRSIYDIKHRLLLPDGSVKWVREKCETFYNEEGIPVRSMGTTQDITDSHTLELELSLATTAINNTMSSIFIADLEGQVAYANPASAKYWGYRNVTRMMEERPHVMDYWTEDTKGQAEAIVQELTMFGVFTGQGLVGRRADGTTFPVEVNACLMRNSEGVPISIICSFSDTTASKEAASRILQALIEGQEHERKRISMEIHDQLGQDLTGIKLRMHHLNELIRSASIPMEEKESLEVQMKHALSGLKQAIQFTSSLGGQLYPPILQDARIECVLEDLLGKYRSSCHHILFSLAVKTPIPEMDDRMRLAIFRIVQEGLTNVVRHSEATSATVTLSATRGRLSLTLSDNGTGYPENYRHTQGFGLRGINERVHALSGTVRFTGGHGATIQVTIPIRKK